jgi:ribosomal protein L30/L7E
MGSMKDLVGMIPGAGKALKMLRLKTMLSTRGSNDSPMT